MAKKLNKYQKIMKTKIRRPNDSRGITRPSTVGASARWLRNHKQTNNGKTFEKR